MKAVHISLSPNTEADDARLAAKILLMPWRWRREAALNEAQTKLEQKLGRPALLMSSGRGALYHLLQAASIGHGDEVIVQAFTCVTVPAAVQWTGATPVYADISAETYNFDVSSVASRITPATKAIIIQHTFGIPGPVKELKELVAGRGILLIEDMAHALGAELDGASLGTFGDAAVLSFGRDKALSSVFGGAIVTADEQLLSRVKEIDSRLPFPSAAWVAQQLWHPIVMAIIGRTYTWHSFGKILLVLLQQMRLLSKAVSPAEKMGERPPVTTVKYSSALAVLLSRQLDKLDRYTRRRRSIASRYQAELSGQSGLPELALGSSWLRFPLLVNDRGAWLKTAKQQQVILGDWYNSVVTPCETDLETLGYEPGSCPVAEAVAASVINLPTYPTMTDAQVERVIKVVKELL